MYGTNIIGQLVITCPLRALKVKTVHTCKSKTEHRRRIPLKWQCFLKIIENNKIKNIQILLCFQHKIKILLLASCSKLDSLVHYISFDCDPVEIKLFL